MVDREQVWHYIALLVLAVIVLIAGLVFGLELSSSLSGTEGLSVVIFSVSFLNCVMVFLLAAQVMRLRQDAKATKGTSRGMKK